MHRVVCTGLGVVAPNGSDVPTFASALREGRSGIRFQPRMEELGMACQVAGQPQIPALQIRNSFDEVTLRAVNSVMLYAGLAAVECWRDAGFQYDPVERGCVAWETGAIIGTGVGGMDTIAEYLIPMVNCGKTRRMGSTIPEQVMCSSASAFVAGLLGLGGEVTTVSSACATGTEALVHAYTMLQTGRMSRMLAGSAEGASVYSWAAFDAMRICSCNFNREPERASRPLSKSAGGFVPAAGAGVVMLETLESAQARGARIYAEILGGAANCGGQRNGGTITAANPAGMQSCMRQALRSARIGGPDIDYVNGHLTATAADPKEVANIAATLDVLPDSFPWLNSTKSMIGHALGAAGGIEAVASVIQLHGGFVHPSVNTEDLHPMIPLRARIPTKCVDAPISTAMKVSFGFGDMNACVVLRKWSGVRRPDVEVQTNRLSK